DSMEPRMTTGDVVIVRSQPTAETGDIAIILVGDNDATCKKIKMTPEGIMLISLNPAYEPMFYNNKEIEQLPIRIIGKVIELRAKF
ncbi:MAG: S24 family peptidase, partial [Clostridia bacterium]|nr:S24 family peptidase [Clostridia bacterium]